MKFLIDAQLPRRLVAWLGSAGCDAIHTLDLPDQNRTTDEQLIECAHREQRPWRFGARRTDRSSRWD